jgi:hypothetical protein
LAYTTLNKAGLSLPQPSRRESLLPTDLHDKIYKAYDFDSSGLTITTSISPDKVWQDLAIDVFVGNLEQKHWGWEDARTVWLLDFWKELDSHVNFVLVYSAPEFVLGKALCNRQATFDEIDWVLASWMTYHTEILRFYNRNPERCLLVNAEAITRDPKTFIDKVGNSFSMELTLPSDNQLESVDSISTISATLAKALLKDNDAYVLYSELESVADIVSTHAIETHIEKYQALEEFIALLVRFDKAKIDIISQNTECANQLTDVQIKLEAECQKLTIFSSQQTELTQENELLRLQLHQVQEELEQNYLQIQELRQASDEQTKLAQKQTISSGQQTELTQENELLLLQLHQVQEELEHYFIQYQEILTKKADIPSEMTPLINNFWKKHQPTEIVIDFRDEIEGNNWYAAEVDGSWAGPGNVSTVKLPALRKGHYEFYLDIVDAMSPEIIGGMEISLNGAVLKTTVDVEGYPTMVFSQFVIDSAGDQIPIWEFQIKFPHLISPVQHGLADNRHLAIRVRTLKLRVIS